MPQTLEPPTEEDLRVCSWWWCCSFMPTSSPAHLRMLSTKVKVTNIVSCSESKGHKVPSNALILPFSSLCWWLLGKATMSMMYGGQGEGMVNISDRVNPCSPGKEAAVPGRPVSSHEPSGTVAPTTPHLYFPDHRVPQAAVHKLLSQISSLTSPWKAQRPRGNWRESNAS